MQDEGNAACIGGERNIFPLGQKALYRSLHKFTIGNENR